VDDSQQISAQLGDRPKASARRLVVWVLLAMSLLALWMLGRPLLVSPKLLAADDFVLFWAAGRVFLQGGDPYDPTELTPVYHVAGRTTFAEGAFTIMWNPPWILPGLALFGALPYPEARLLWLLANLAMVLASAYWAWRTYGGAPHKVWGVGLAALTFVPALQALQAGQLGPIILALTVGFVALAERRRVFWAGAVVALLSIKPQLVLLVGLVALFWMLRRRNLLAVAGGVCALLVTSGVALAINPSVFRHFLNAVAAYPPVEWATPTVGGVLRALTGGRHFWLQAAPLVAGATWAGLYWVRRRQGWTWSAHLPLLLLVSMLTAPYGWAYDMVLLVIPVVAIAAGALARPWTRRMTWICAGYLAIDLTMLVLHIVVKNSFWFFWVAPALLIWYLNSRQSNSPPIP
jgi:hypothetical protein